MQAVDSYPLKEKVKDAMFWFGVAVLMIVGSNLDYVAGVAQ